MRVPDGAIADVSPRPDLGGMPVGWIKCCAGLYVTIGLSVIVYFAVEKQKLYFPCVMLGMLQLPLLALSARAFWLNRQADLEGWWQPSTHTLFHFMHVVFCTLHATLG